MNKEYPLYPTLSEEAIEAQLIMIRHAIFKEYRDEIINDLNQDLVRENEELKELIKLERKSRYT